MPVTKSAKKALKTAIRRHEENLHQKAAYKGALKAVRKAAASGEAVASELIAKAQSTLDIAAKKNTIHPNKAARLKSRLVKQVKSLGIAPKPAKATPKKTAAKKPAAKKTSAKK